VRQVAETVEHEQDDLRRVLEQQRLEQARVHGVTRARSGRAAAAGGAARGRR
jgi:hypothetical protein